MTVGQFYRLADGMARMALKADSAQYHLGYIWWVLQPLIFVGIFYLVFELILQIGQPDFVVFLMCGNLPFMWFSQSVAAASNSIVSSASLIGRINVPKALFPVSTIQEGVYKQLAVFSLLLGVVIAAGHRPDLHWLWLLPIAGVQYLMIVSCGLIGAVLVCYIRDFMLVISLAMTFLMFVSGIFWNVRDLPNPVLVDIVLTWNPMAFILDAYREVLMHDRAPDVVHLLAVGLVFAFLLWAMLKLMALYNKQIALRALSA